MTAGPAKASAVRSPPRWPASAPRAVATVRSVSDARSIASLIAELVIGRDAYSNDTKM